MEVRNLISACENANALLEVGADLAMKYFNLKPHEVLGLKSMCQELDNHSCSIRKLDGFYISYRIPQIKEEFVFYPRLSIFHSIVKNQQVF